MYVTDEDGTTSFSNHVTVGLKGHVAPISQPFDLKAQVMKKSKHYIF